MDRDVQPHDPYAALRERNYVLYASGYIFSAISLSMVTTALGWEIYDRTRDAFMLGLVGVAKALPVVLLALPAGHLVDVVDRRKVLAITQGGFAIVIGLMALVVSSHGSTWTLLALVALLGCCRVGNGPARSALLPSLVSDAAFPNAIAWTTGLFQSAALAGPVLAGLLIDHFHASWPVLAFSALGCSALGVTAMLTRPREVKRARRGLSLLAMGDGLRHLFRERLVLAAITLDLFAVLVGGATALMPVYAKEIYGVGARELGWLIAAPFVGALVMSVVLAHRPPMKHAGPSLLWSVAGFGACTIVFGLSTNLWLGMAALVVLGGLDSVSVYVRHILVPARTPEELRGRVSAVNSVFIECSNELGAFESGLVARLLNPVASVVSGGIGTILVVLGVALAFPQLRKLRMIAPIEPDAKA
ncbi:MAG: MFS transporter [Phycisphaerales bacterium]|nr:MFS transporter [Phycisphaerales bacterium]